jgi:hypothetical protein
MRVELLLFVLATLARGGEIEDAVDRALAAFAKNEATRALMVKFYELWNPKDRSKQISAAAALHQAQTFVASHKAWKDPRYWAAWQLWGLPE